jgi:hypothetical protein
MGGNMEALPTWESGIFSKILRDAAAAVAQQTISAAALWDAIFNAPELWLDVEDDAGRQVRPTEIAALRNIFASCTGAKTVWNRWLDDRDAELYGTQLQTVADNLPFAAAMTAEEERKAAAKAYRKAMRESQLPLPAPLGVAA